jgi:DNA-binding CsgD family transcriptional regulator
MVATSDDETALLDLIHANRIAVWTQDFEAYQKCFVHASYTARWNASPVTGILVRQGWDEIATKVRQMFSDFVRDADPMAGHANAYDTEILDLVIRISGDMAWATYRQQYPAVTPPAGTLPSRAWHHAGSSPSHEMRVFERHDGQWRIAFLCFLDPDTGRSGPALLGLGPDGSVQWESKGAREVMERDDDLVLRAGRLRIRDAKTNARLQAAIKWAADLAAPVIPGRGALPIVMQAGDGVAAKVWWIIGESGKIYFSLGEQDQDEIRLKAAAIVYGLSPAQKQVAKYILAGCSLTEVSQAMSITSNTARTHLNRIFEKTGVRTQSALVRALLYAAPPI